MTIAYGWLDRLLHRVALGSPAALELGFELERARFGAAAAALSPRPPVFVTGLARAGTTVLMQMIHRADAFAALTYRDMPFALAPNTWAGLTRHLRRAVARTERGHGDGLDHDLDSPEAIEEVFWRTHESAHYQRADGLCAHVPTPGTLDRFRLYMRLVCLRHGTDRYLSKNNANVLRLGSLAQGLPGAVLIHPFRDPFEQAASLLAQHRRACELGRADRFRADYMRWLGHHEFGVHQRRFLLPPGSTVEGDPDRLVFWLRTWTGVYSHLLAQSNAVAARQCFVDYDRLAVGDPALLDRLRTRLALPRPLDGTHLRAPPRRAAIGPDVPQQDAIAARAVHARLIARAQGQAIPVAMTSIAPIAAPASGASTGTQA